MINPRGPRPAYLQLAELLERQIRAGELGGDDPIPSETTLTQEHGIARNTVRAAVRVLRDRGLVYTVPHRGTYVRPRDQWADR